MSKPDGVQEVSQVDGVGNSATRLCSVCRRIDIRALLEQPSPANPAAPYGYAHHRNGGALARAAENGCELNRQFDSNLFYQDQLRRSLQSFRLLYVQGSIESQLRLFQERGLVHQPLNGPIRSAPVGMASEHETITGLLVTPEADTDLCFRIMNQWLRSCIQEHPECEEGAHFLPSRVIDVGTRDGPQVPRLHITNGKVGSWVALSHRWGDQSILQTLVRNLAIHIKQLPQDLLSPTFRDAIYITRRLGYWYLWIDSICIVQDSPEDWAKESACMRVIYQKAILTIAASHPDSATAGILAPRYRQYPSPSNPSTGADFEIPCGGTGYENASLYVRGRMLDDCSTFRNRDRNVLESRGWILQETILAPKTIYWGATQMHWQCRTCVGREAERKPEMLSQQASWRLMRQYNLKVLMNDSISHWNNTTGTTHTDKALLYEVWLILVQNFCTRDLKFAQDTFPALSGLAQIIQSALGDEYWAGCWSGDIRRSLLWTYKHGITVKESSVAPSWSWAGKTSFLRCDEDPFQMMLNSEPWVPAMTMDLEVLGGTMVLETLDTFGRLKAGILEVRGWVCLLSSRYKSIHMYIPHKYSQKPCTVTWQDRGISCSHGNGDFDDQWGRLYCMFDDRPEDFAECYDKFRLEAIQHPFTALVVGVYHEKNSAHCIQELLHSEKVIQIQEHWDFFCKTLASIRLCTIGLGSL